MPAARPLDLITVGYIAGAYGLRGWVRITPYSKQADALLHAKTWWLDQPNRQSETRSIEVIQAKFHGDKLVAQFADIARRELAEMLQGAVVKIARAHFPVLSDDEFYWIDLIGLQVENLTGQRLGIVAGLMDNGAHSILRIKSVYSKPSEILIPFVSPLIQSVIQAEKKMIVDWELDAI